MRSGLLKFKIHTKHLILLCFALYAFCSNKPYFLWETYKNKSIGFPFGVPLTSLLALLTISVSLVYCLRKNKIQKKNFNISLYILLASFFLVFVSGGTEHALSFEWLIYFVPVMFLLFDDDDKILAYEMYLFLFAVTLILPIIYYLLVKVGVSVPFSELQSYEEIKVINNGYYKLYPFGAAQLTHRYSSWLAELRMSGIYDESGRLGTLAGLFLVSERFEIRKNWKNMIILLGGILSFSVAFYVIVIVYYLAENIRSKKTKNVFLLLGVVLIYIVFMTIDFSNPALSYLKSRLIISGTGLSGDNRTNAVFDSIFNTIYSGSVKNLLFGYGYGALGALRSAVMADGSSYKTLIFDFGYVGFLVQIIWLILFTIHEAKYLSKNNKGDCYIVLIVYLLNMYQRPTMFNMVFMLIFIGGILKIKAREVPIIIS